MPEKYRKKEGIIRSASRGRKYRNTLIWGLLWVPAVDKAIKEEKNAKTEMVNDASGERKEDKRATVIAARNLRDQQYYFEREENRNKEEPTEKELMKMHFIQNKKIEIKRPSQKDPFFRKKIEEIAQVYKDDTTVAIKQYHQENKQRAEKASKKQLK